MKLIGVVTGCAAAARTGWWQVEAGLNLAGRYLLEALVGRGGMGEVWRATDQELGRPVAVKVMLASLAASPDAARRFRREARTVAKLSHPGIVVVHDVGSHDGQPFMVMEFLHGRDVAAMLAASPEGLRIGGLGRSCWRA